MLFDPDQFAIERSRRRLENADVPGGDDGSKEDINVVFQKGSFALDYKSMESPQFGSFYEEQCSSRAAVPPIKRALAAARAHFRDVELALAEKYSQQQPQEIARLREEAHRKEEADIVLSGKEHLYRDPKGPQRAASLAKSAIIPHSSIQMRSQPSMMMYRGMLADHCTGRMEAAKRACLYHLTKLNEQQQKQFEADERAEKKVKKGTPPATAEAAEVSKVKRKKVLDPSFYVGSRAALYPQGTMKDSGVEEPKAVARLGELFPESPIFSDSPPSADGEFGVFSTSSSKEWERNVLFAVGAYESHFVAALAALQRCCGSGSSSTSGGSNRNTGRELIRSLFVFPPKTAADRENCEEGEAVDEEASARRLGCVGVLLYIGGEWEYVIVDDYIAVGEKNEPLFLRSANLTSVVRLQNEFGPFNGKVQVRNAEEVFSLKAKTTTVLEDLAEAPIELWPLFLEKALAKAFGSFDAIDGGVAVETMVSLCGGAEKQLSLLQTNNAAGAPGGGGGGSRFKSTRVKHTRIADAPSSSSHAKESSKRTIITFEAFQDALEGRAVLAHPNPSVFVQPHVSLSPSKKKVAAIGEHQPVDYGEFDPRVSKTLSLPALPPFGVRGREDITRSYILYNSFDYVITNTWRDDGNGIAIVELFSPWGAIAIPNSPADEFEELVGEEEFLDDTELLYRRCFLRLSWDDFQKYFIRVATCALPQKDEHTVIVSGIAPSQVTAEHHTQQEEEEEEGKGNYGTPANSLYFSPLIPPLSTRVASPAYYLHLRAPLKATVSLLLEQADPKATEALPHSMKKTLPYCQLQLFVHQLNVKPLSTGMEDNEDDDPGRSLPTTVSQAMKHFIVESFVSPLMYARQVFLPLLLEPGYFLIQPKVFNGPAVPFTLKVNAPAQVVLTLWAVGGDKRIDAVTTWGLPPTYTQFEAVPDAVTGTTSVASQSVTPTKQDLVPPTAPRQRPPGLPELGQDPQVVLQSLRPLCASDSLQDSLHQVFQQADIFARGELDHRGVERAAAEFLLKHTTFGSAISRMSAAMKKEEEKQKIEAARREAREGMGERRRSTRRGSSMSSGSWLSDGSSSITVPSIPTVMREGDFITAMLASLQLGVEASRSIDKQ